MLLSRQHCCSTATDGNSHFALLSPQLIELIINRSSQSCGIVCRSLYQSFFVSSMYTAQKLFSHEQQSTICSVESYF